ncbi:MAG: MIP family channel protein [Firmicutes bacterium]|nr:MIP family channel protein [Bacillota bacterium]
MKKYFSELIGTCVLVFMGCGTAMLVGCDAAAGGGYILTALAFGLSVVAMAYCVGNISGGHFNAAVTLAMLIRKKISSKDAVMYWIFQVIGAFVATALLAAIFGLGGVKDMTGGFGSNGLAGVNGNALAGLLVEIILTFIFLMTIQGVTSEKFKHGSFGGLIIGLTLTFVHIFGIGLTGTSVNPSRSIAPAIVAAIAGNSAPLASLWVFIVGPLVGAALAALVYPALEKE